VVLDEHRYIASVVGIHSFRVSAVNRTKLLFTLTSLPTGKLPLPFPCFQLIVNNDPLVYF
jgi:hypothetical protein